MKQHDILYAYLTIKRIDNTIPYEVLDFMKDCAINVIKQMEYLEEQKRMSDYLISKGWTKDGMGHMKHHRYGTRFIKESYDIQSRQERQELLDNFKL